jgi:hypothetical protein
MKKKIVVFGCVVVAVLTVLIFWYLVARFSYAKRLSFYHVHKQENSGLTIGVIGDSWVAGKKIDTALHELLLTKSIQNRVISSGHSGAKTKLIYQNMFKDNRTEHSSKFVVESKPDYCVVLAGVNDSFGQLGKGFYSHHMVMIIKMLLHYKIEPIVVELPEFGIMQATSEVGLIKRLRYKIFSYFTNSGELNNIIAYRNEFNRKLRETKLDDKIIFVGFDEICSDYDKNLTLYRNSLHLSNEGNDILAKVISRYIANDFFKKQARFSWNN